MRPLSDAGPEDVKVVRASMLEHGVTVFDLMLADCVQAHLDSRDYVHPELTGPALLALVKRHLADTGFPSSQTARRLDHAYVLIFEELAAEIDRSLSAHAGPPDLF